MLSVVKASRRQPWLGDAGHFAGTFGRPGAGSVAVLGIGRHVTKTRPYRTMKGCCVHRSACGRYRRGANAEEVDGAPTWKPVTRLQSHHWRAPGRRQQRLSKSSRACLDQNWAQLHGQVAADA